MRLWLRRWRLEKMVNIKIKNMAFKKGHVPIKPFLKGFTPWNKGKKMSGESREKMSIAKKGRPAWNKGKKGKPHSEEWKKKMSLIHKGRKCS